MAITTVSPSSLRKMSRRVTYKDIHRMLKHMDEAEAQRLVEQIPDWSTKREAKALLRACYVS